MSAPTTSKSEQGKLIVGVPSKGRLQENTLAFFARAGLSLQQGRGDRDYRGSMDGIRDVEVLFLSASEIAGQLANGDVHLGITGEDLIRESIADADSRLVMLTPLGFGHANVVVAVPQAWIDVRSMADLEDVAAAFHARHGRRMRVATKYVNLTRQYFASHSVSDYRIVESLGATEGAPASGAAELIVDITTTGATLAANALKILDDGIMLRSEANLVASTQAPWGASQRGIAARLFSRIAAEEQARLTREVQVSLETALDFDALRQPLEQEFRARLIRESAGEAVLHCPKAQAPALCDWLIGNGAAQARVLTLDYVFSRDNSLQDRLAARIGPLQPAG